MNRRTRLTICCGLLAVALAVGVTIDRSGRTDAVQTVPTPVGQLGGAPSLTAQPVTPPPTPETTATASLEERVATLEARVGALEATVAALAGQP